MSPSPRAVPVTSARTSTLRGLLALAMVVLLAAPGSALATAPSDRPAVAPPPGVPVVTPGAFDWPLPGIGDAAPARAGETGSVTRPFLPPPHPYGRGHRGADLAAPAGTTVLAAGAGAVVFAGLLAGRGVVSVEHAGGLRTTYEPVTAGVAVGVVVARGDPLGTLTPGHRGCAAPACLHWGLRRAVPAGVEYLDPLLLLGLGTVRLLPSRAPRRLTAEPGKGSTPTGRRRSVRSAARLGGSSAGVRGLGQACPQPHHRAGVQLADP